MKVTRIVGVTELYNSLRNRPNYKEEEDAKKRKDEEKQYNELKEKMEDFQSHLEKYKEENKDNPYEKEGVDLEELRKIVRRID